MRGWLVASNNSALHRTYGKGQRRSMMGKVQHQRQVCSFFPSRVQANHTWATQSPTDRPTSWQLTFRRPVARSEGRELNWNNQNQKVKWKVGKLCRLFYLWFRRPINGPSVGSKLVFTFVGFASGILFRGFRGFSGAFHSVEPPAPHAESGRCKCAFLPGVYFSLPDHLNWFVSHLPNSTALLKAESDRLRFYVAFFRNAPRAPNFWSHRFIIKHNSSAVRLCRVRWRRSRSNYSAYALTFPSGCGRFSTLTLH